MISTRAYYLLKPVIPWRVRLALRRRRASRMRIDYADVWPIDPRAAEVPPNWPGWPDGKQFSLVLTHDVEGAKGLSRVERLMNVEREHGFRSSFNFVPVGEYQLSDSERQMLERSGFEIGVHGLEHDGKLYASKADFASKADRIKQYLERWNARGFRSPLMQHRLSWLHELGVAYDCSTFDTDPFEPQPDGAATIFPFWVPNPKGDGYVELPYTLAQDFTLFVVLQERNIDLWKRKLDWVAQHGGMALINTHPDYMCFDGSEKDRDEYPARFYEEFLSYVQDNYAGQYWSALPRDVARFYCTSLPPTSRNTRKKICMLTCHGYDSDGRVRRYAETLAKRGDLVEVIAMSSDAEPMGSRKLKGVTVHGLQRRSAGKEGKWGYAWHSLQFLLGSSFFLTRRHQRYRYDLIHVHNMPDFLVFAAWYPKLTGVKIILDVHDIVPELFANKFKTSVAAGYVKVLKLVEKASAAFADYVIISNHLWREKLTSRSVGKEKCSVFVNHVDQAIFYRRARTRTDGKCIVIFPGSFQWHQGLDIAIEAFSIVRKRVAGAEFHIYGGGVMKDELVRLAAQLGLDGSVKFLPSVPLEQIADVIANADLGVVPKRADSFGNEAYSTKIMEFMSQGVPVVASRTKIDTFYFNDRLVHFFPSGDAKAMAEAMLHVIEDRGRREVLVNSGLEYVDRHGWNENRKDYLDLVDSLSIEVFGNSNPGVRLDVNEQPVAAPEKD